MQQLKKDSKQQMALMDVADSRDEEMTVMSGNSFAIKQIHTLIQQRRLDDFANVMVNLGAENYNFTAEEVKALVQDEIDKQKKRLDNESKELLDQEMATNWKDVQNDAHFGTQMTSASAPK